eukprot:303994_1
MHLNTLRRIMANTLTTSTSSCCFTRTAVSLTHHIGISQRLLILRHSISLGAMIVTAKKPAIQKALSKDYERYLRNTRDIVDKPKYLKHWWKSNEREYKYLSVIALRCLNALRGGCAVERSFNHFSKMNRSGNAATMGPLNKEVRTMCHWNKELIANGLFDLTSL